MATHALHRLVAELPHPIAALAARAVQAEAGRERHDAAFYLGEASLKLAAAARVGAWLEKPAPGSDLARRLEGLVLPSTGAWCGFLRDVGAELDGHPLGAAHGELSEHRKDWRGVAGFAEALVDDEVVARETVKQARRRGILGFFELLVVYRNEVLGHGAQRDRAFYIRYGDRLVDALSEVLQENALWGGLRLRTTRLEVDGRDPRLRWVELTGLVPLPLEGEPSLQKEAASARAEHLFFWDEGHLVPLHPLVIATEGLRIGFLNKATTRRDAIRRAHYLDYATGESLEDVDARPALAALLSTLRGQDVDVAEVTTLAESLAPAPRADHGLEVGTEVGPYRLQRQLGAGAIGQVFGAHDTKLDRRVAIKVLSDLELEAARRLEGEARALAQLDHPHIVRVLGLEAAEGRSLLVMEWISGETLARRIGTGLSLERLSRWGGQIAEALAAAHDAGVLHRDLKPANVMVDEEDEVVVLDFGLAQSLDAEPGLELAGTPAYMAPEQAEGGRIDARSDVFALGVTLYEMACGERPFAGGTTVSVLSSVIKDAPVPLGRRRPGLPPAFVKLVERCLEKDPARRYQSARDVALELDSIGDEPPRGSDPRWPFAIAGVAVGALAATVLLPREPTVAAPSALSTTPSSASAAPAEPPPWSFRRLAQAPGDERDPYLAPDATWFVYAVDDGGDLDVFRQRVGGDRRTLLTEGSDADDTQPAVAPDGQTIAFRSERDGGGIFVMGATGESVRRVIDEGFHPRWSPDGRRLVVSSHRVDNPRSRGTLSQLFAVDVESGEKTPIPVGRDGVQGTWSPAGDRVVAFGSLDAERHGLLVSAPDGEPSLRFDRGDAVVWTPFWADAGIFFASNAGGAMNVWRLGDDGEVEPVTAGVAVAADHPTVSRDGASVLFRATLTRGNLARVPLEDGAVVGPPELLTRGVNGFSSPDLSPDGEHVALCSCWVRSDVHENIYVMRPDGGGFRALTHDEGKSNRLPRWLDDERIVFYSNRSGSWELWGIDRDGSDLQQLTRAPTHVLLFAIPRPADGRVAAWLNMEGLAVVPADELATAGFGHAIVHPEPDHQFVPSDWSPEGDAVLGSVGFEGDSLGVTRLELEARRFVGLTDHGEAPRHLAGRVAFAHDGRLVTVRVDGSDEQPLLEVPGRRIHEHFAVGPAARWLYVSLTSEDSDLWLASRQRSLSAER